jgi:hypothetical protein
MTPEQQSRQQFDAMLVASGWSVQIKDKINLSASRGVAICELSFAAGEQTRIVAEVERRLSVVEELESVVSANLQRATRLRQSILQKAFTGGLVNEQSVTIENAKG